MLIWSVLILMCEVTHPGECVFIRSLLFLVVKRDRNRDRDRDRDRHEHRHRDKTETERDRERDAEIN